jgi:hypothetical protein
VPQPVGAGVGDRLARVVLVGARVDQGHVRLLLESAGAQRGGVRRQQACDPAAAVSGIFSPRSAIGSIPSRCAAASSETCARTAGFSKQQASARPGSAPTHAVGSCFKRSASLISSLDAPQVRSLTPCV